MTISATSAARLSWMLFRFRFICAYEGCLVPQPWLWVKHLMRRQRQTRRADQGTRNRRMRSQWAMRISLLRRMPGDVFADPSGYSLPKSSWEGWLKWAGDIGMLK